MQIKEIANKLNISPRAVRFYEEKGLLSPAKQENNQYRTFVEKDVWRLQTIISLREAGMPLTDIKKALDEIDETNHEQLQYYLELQRTVMMSQWLEIKQVIETTDHMIALLKTKNTLPLEDIYQLAEASKLLREQRKNWKDKWNFDQQASTHDERVSTNTGNYSDYEQALALIVKWVSPIQGEQGLDIGAGTGNLAGRLIELGASMSAVDQSREMLRQCQRKHPDLETKLGNFLALPYLGGQFDFVVSSFAFHHLTTEQQLLALEEMRRVLKPRGRICLADLMHTAHDPIQENSEEYPIMPVLHRWFEENGYMIKQHQINHLLHILYAVPIR
ncbi:methyltransferase domain-containing protein [Paenibacillus sp. LMG 31456]|uniref:Methyltransferase domain-containing protein n=1 Tax=Paenibacillus foliorum TaxID=2654974 RepID=A0A972GVN4_9BACL|nr:MerR family transcriptional regulator [Paenibacillus foliorum]NOU97744.1 methyltransferase domain-containing protein [Paenibacillus foliorum]